MTMLEVDHPHVNALVEARFGEAAYRSAGGRYNAHSHKPMNAPSCIRLDVEVGMKRVSSGLRTITASH